MSIHSSACTCARCAPRHPAVRRLSLGMSITLHVAVAAIGGMGLLAMAIGVAAKFAWRGL